MQHWPVMQHMTPDHFMVQLSSSFIWKVKQPWSLCLDHVQYFSSLYFGYSSQRGGKSRLALIFSLLCIHFIAPWKCQIPVRERYANHEKCLCNIFLEKASCNFDHFYWKVVDFSIAKQGSRPVCMFPPRLDECLPIHIIYIYKMKCSDPPKWKTKKKSFKTFGLKTVSLLLCYSVFSFQRHF